VKANGATWNGSVPIKLLQSRYLIGPATCSHLYDVSPDGRRFLMVTAPTTDGGASPTIDVVFNWTEELKQRVPAARTHGHSAAIVMKQRGQNLGRFQRAANLGRNLAFATEEAWPKLILRRIQ
jgi:hypothetical protein